jgi:hypothetical protein
MSLFGSDWSENTALTNISGCCHYNAMWMLCWQTHNISDEEEITLRQLL